MIRGQARTRTGMSFTANKREPRHTFRASTNSATYPKEERCTIFTDRTP